MSYTYLSQDEHYQTQCLRRAGFPLKYIGVELQRPVSTFSRELQRNGASAGGYDSKQAHRQAVKRLHVASVCSRMAARVRPATYPTTLAAIE